jgi:EAL domain-containing protein (putative c-di-GMP-specific phosphodiesterase class I)
MEPQDGSSRHRRRKPLAGPGSPVGGASVPTVIGVIGVTVLITVAVWRTAPSGSPTGLVHLYYLPVIYLAAFVGPVSAALLAAAAGLAAGPFMPVAGKVQVTAGEQPVAEWLVRTTLLVVVAVVVAWLARRQARPVDLLLRDLASARSLRGAIASGRVTVYYQPIVDLADGSVAGLEALCRWTDRSGRHIPPSEFIPVAERTGTIGLLGARVLELAVRQAEAWSDGTAHRPQMSVNVSPSQLSDPAFRHAVAQAVTDSRLESRQLCLEITETAIITDPEAALATVRAARKLGVQVALDDFGTGHSSLAQLAGFPIDVVKIDKAFVDEVDTDPKVRSLVHAIVEMARALGAAAVAEGIERASQLAVLRDLGCPLGQGYHLGRPAPAGAVDLSPRTVA